MNLLSVKSALTALAGAGSAMTGKLLLKNPETALRYMLELLGLAYASNFELRKRIRGLTAKYQFGFGDRDARVAAEIRLGRFRVSAGVMEAPDVCLTFRDGNAMRELFFSAKPDILGAILKQDVVIAGNLTYLYKFAFLAKHLQVKVLGAA
jgi:hypothetical protein